MADRRTLLIGGGAVVVIAVLASAIVIGPSDLFLPEQSTQVDETPADTDAEVVKQGTFTGAAGHDVSGTVVLLRDEDGLLLRFENYSQEQGPDVFVYVTPASTPETSEQIDAGTKDRIDGGADGGESTKEGTFTQRLPNSVSAENINGVGIWCEQFATPFGYANLSAGAG